jgi:glycosyltransferase involved in cell wall biosynthesis
MYSYYDGSHSRAFLKLAWRILKLGVYPAYRLHRRREARHGIDGALARSEFMARIHKPQIDGLVKHIPLGINLTDLPRSRPKRPRTPLRFGFVGGFQPNKGLPEVLGAAAALKREGLAFELHVWGSKEAQGAGEIKAANIEDRVFLRGTYEADQLWDVYSQIDVAVMATIVSEPLGRVPLEAGAVGAPTIAPAIGGLMETIRHGVDGLHFRFRDPEDLLRQMRRVLVESSLFERLERNLPRALDTRQAIARVEEFYFEVLRRG